MWYISVEVLPFAILCGLFVGLALAAVLETKEI